MAELITMGEALVQFNPLMKGPLRHATLFERHVAGAEANVAVAVVRQGRRAAFIGRVGDDEFGVCIENWLRGGGRGHDVAQKRPRGAYRDILCPEGVPSPPEERDGLL
jgi:2-dehydro-3-deoxygluconokinase